MSGKSIIINLKKEKIKRKIRDILYFFSKPFAGNKEKNYSKPNMKKHVSN